LKLYSKGFLSHKGVEKERVFVCPFSNFAVNVVDNVLSFGKIIQLNQCLGKEKHRSEVSLTLANEFPSGFRTLSELFLLN
jgi:hypothetical protein